MPHESAAQTQAARVRLKSLTGTTSAEVEGYVNEGWHISHQEYVAMPIERGGKHAIHWCVTLRKDCPPKPFQAETDALNNMRWFIVDTDDPDGGNTAPAPAPPPTTPPAEPTPEPVSTFHIMPCEDTVPRWQAIVPVDAEPVDEDTPQPVSTTADTLPDDALRLLTIGVLNQYNADGITYRINDDGQIEQALDETTWITNPDATRRLNALNNDPRPLVFPQDVPPEQPEPDTCEMCGERPCRCADYQDNGITYNDPDQLSEPQPRNQLPDRERRRNGSLIEYYDEDLDMWHLDMDAMEVDSLNQSFLRRDPIHIPGLEEVAHA